MAAWLEGKQFQVRYIHGPDKSTWVDCHWSTSFHNLELDKFDYRIKPEPKTPIYRPWKPEEVPVGAWIKTNTYDYNGFTSIIGVSNDEIMTMENSLEDMFITFSYALEKNVHSIDKGKTWLPCGVEIKEEK